MDLGRQERVIMVEPLELPPLVYPEEIPEEEHDTPTISESPDDRV